ncbi:MAG TPA: hypothetical protein VE995_01670 [Gaiellaceae bacterium]|nr:hypothetical protein [Gaiellaceae bacterium]
MGYKLLGFLVWRGARWYVRRRYPGAPRKLMIGAGVAAAVGAGGAAAVALARGRS